MMVGAVEQGHLALGEQEQGDDLVFRLHNVQNVQNMHTEHAGVTRGYKGTLQKLHSGFCPLRGGTPPFR